MNKKCLGQMLRSILQLRTVLRLSTAIVILVASTPGARAAQNPISFDKTETGFRIKLDPGILLGRSNPAKTNLPGAPSSATKATITSDNSPESRDNWVFKRMDDGAIFYPFPSLANGLESDTDFILSQLYPNAGRPKRTEWTEHLNRLFATFNSLSWSSSDSAIQRLVDVRLGGHYTAMDPFDQRRAIKALEPQYRLWESQMTNCGSYFHVSLPLNPMPYDFSEKGFRLSGLNPDTGGRREVFFRVAEENAEKICKMQGFEKLGRPTNRSALILVTEGIVERSVSGPKLIRTSTRVAWLESKVITILNKHDHTATHDYAMTSDYRLIEVFACEPSGPVDPDYILLHERSSNGNKVKPRDSQSYASTINSTPQRDDAQNSPQLPQRKLVQSRDRVPDFLTISDTLLSSGRYAYTLNGLRAAVSSVETDIQSQLEIYSNELTAAVRASQRLMKAGQPAEAANWAAKSESLRIKCENLRLMDRSTILGFLGARVNSPFLQDLRELTQASAGPASERDGLRRTALVDSVRKIRDRIVHEQKAIVKTYIATSREDTLAQSMLHHILDSLQATAALEAALEPSSQAIDAVRFASLVGTLQASLDRGWEFQRMHVDRASDSKRDKNGITTNKSIVTDDSATNVSIAGANSSFNGTSEDSLRAHLEQTMDSFVELVRQGRMIPLGETRPALRDVSSIYAPAKEWITTHIMMHPDRAMELVTSILPPDANSEINIGMKSWADAYETTSIQWIGWNRNARFIREAKYTSILGSILVGAGRVKREIAISNVTQEYLASPSLFRSQLATKYQIYETALTYESPGERNDTKERCGTYIYDNGRWVAIPTEFSYVRRPASRFDTK